MKKINNWIYLIIGLFLSILCIFCFIHYSKQFLETILDNKELARWLFFGICVFGTFIVGIINLVNNNKLLKENIELKELIIKLSDDANSNYYSTLEHIKNSREISLDVLDELREKP